MEDRSFARSDDGRTLFRPSSIVPRFALLDHLGDNAGAHGPAALTDGEAKALVHRNRRDQLHAARHIVARHHHLDALGELHHSRHVRRPEIELRTVAVEERRVPPALFLRQDVRLRLELRVRRDAPRLRQHHPALHFFLLDTAQEDTHVVTGLALIQKLPEHLDARHHRLLRRLDSYDLDFIANLHDTALDPARHHRAAASYRKHVFYRHQILLVYVALGLQNKAVDGRHELQNAL